MNSDARILQLGTWSAIAGASNVLVLALLYLLFARHLSQEELGVYAIISSLVLLAVAAIENSFSTGLITMPDIVEEDYSAVSTINFITALLFSFILMAVSYVFKIIYALELIPLLTFCLMPILFFSAFNSPHIAGLKKMLAFKKLAILDLTSLGFYALITLILLYFQWGYWALIIGLITKHVVFTILLLLTRATFCASIIKPSNPQIKKHFRFGKYVMYEKLFTSSMSYLDVFLIGYFVNIQVLGAYDIIKKIALRPFLLAYQYLEDVVFPMLSGQQHKDNYNKVYNKFIWLTALLIFPSLSLLYINSPWLIRFLPFEYHGYTMLLQLLLLFAAMIILLNPLDIILYSQGQSRLFFRWYAVASTFQIILTVISLQFSVFLFLISLSTYYFVLYLLAYPTILSSGNVLRASNYFSSFKLLFPFIIILCFAQMAEPTSSAVQLSGSLVIIIVAVIMAYCHKKNDLEADQH